VSAVARATAQRYALVSCLTLALAWGAAACTLVDDPASEPDAPSLAVTTGSLLIDTMLVHFTVRGDGLVNTSLGAQVPNSDTSASVTFTQVPEGVKFVSAWGMDFDSARGSAPGWPNSMWRLNERGAADFFRVTSHQRHAVSITTNPGPPGNQEVGVARYILNPRYTFAAGDPFAGSPDGSNITELYIDAPTDTDCVDAFIDRDSAFFAENPIGLFTELPAIWPDPDLWVDRIDDLDLDANRLGRLYVVAKPMAIGHDVTFQITGSGGSVGCDLFAEIYLRLSGYGGITGSAE
jgi:hypothetical protein